MISYLCFRETHICISDYTTKNFPKSVWVYTEICHTQSRPLTSYLDSISNNPFLVLATGHGLWLEQERFSKDTQPYELHISLLSAEVGRFQVHGP